MAFNSHAADIVDNGLYYNIISLSDLTVELVQPDNGHYSGNITIPETIEYMSRTFTVTGINKNALSNCNIGTLSIKDNIKSIGELRGIGSINTFRIEDSDIPLEMEENASEWSWYYQKDPMTVYIGRNIVTDFRANLFGEYCGAVSAEFGTKVTEIPSELFERCSTLESVTIPNNIETIGGYAFYQTSLTSIQGLGVISIGTGAFWRCASLKSAEFSESLTSIEGYAFSDCTSLTDFILPSNTHQLKVIDSNAFGYCTALTSFVIPEGVCFVGSFAFSGCTNLESVKIPNSVVDFGNITGESGGGVFKGCIALKTITVGHNTPISTWENSFDASTYLSATLKVPVGSSEAYKNANYWKNFFNIQEDETIADELCTIAIKQENQYYYQGSVEVSVNDNYGEWYNYWSHQKNIITKRGSEAKVTILPETNYKLVSLNINGEDVISSVIRNEYTFSVNDNMELLIQPVFEYDEYQTIRIEKSTFVRQDDGTYAITDLSEDVTEYAIPETITYNGKTLSVSRIEANAFEDNVNLTSISIPATITSIGNGAFAGCVNLASIYVYHEEPITFGSAEAHRASGSIFDGVNMETCILYVPYGCADKYKSASVWNEFQHIVEMKSTSIKNVVTGQAGDGFWYSLSGYRIDGKPSKKGIYIKNGMKMYIK